MGKTNEKEQNKIINKSVSKVNTDSYRRNQSPSSASSSTSVISKIVNTNVGKKGSSKNSLSISQLPISSPTTTSRNENQRLYNSQPATVNNHSCSGIEDQTTSEIDEDSQNYNKATYSNKTRKSKFPVRQFFSFTKTGGWCESCKKNVPMAYRSDANLRSHLANHHNMPEVLLPSQIRRKNGESFKGKLPYGEKRKLDYELINCIIKDSRTFNDFNKPGMRRFLNAIKPGYIPCCRENVGKHLKNR
jgi:hypothetical protein